MADGSGYDPCECIYGHESAMQRLLSLLRQSQSYCTDNVCSTELPGPQGQSDSGGMTVMMILTVWLVLMVIMYMFGMTPRRNSGKPRDDFSRMDRDPPAIS